MHIPSSRMTGSFLVGAMMAIFLAGCTAPQPTQAPTATATAAEPTATATAVAPMATPQPAPTPQPTATPLPTAAPTSTPTPTATPTPTPPPTPLPNVYDAYGFTVALDPDSAFANSDLTVAGFTKEQADKEQGALSFVYKGATILLFWVPRGEQTPQSIVAMTYQLLRSNQPNVTFDAISEGDLEVNSQAGRFGGFVATDSSGESAGGGLIGAWICPGTSTAFSLTATGPDATALQIRFDRLIEGFKCAA